MSNQFKINAGERLYLDPPWIPTDEVDFIGQFDATDASTISTDAYGVTEWREKTGTGRDLKENVWNSGADYALPQYQINGMDTVRLLNQEKLVSDDFASIDSTDGVSMFYVGYYNDQYTLGEAIRMQSTDNSDYLMIRKEGGNENEVSINNLIDGGGSNFPRIKITNNVYLQPHIMTGFYDNTQYAIWGNGGLDKATRSRPSGTFTVNQFGVGKISGNQTDVVIGEVLYFKTSNLAVREKAEGYLAHKWNVPLVAGHPYEDLRP